MKRSLKFALAASASLLLLAACEMAPAETTTANGSDSVVATGYDSDMSGSVIPGSQADLEANVGDRVLFGTDSSVLGSEAQATLDRQAGWLRQYEEVSITVEGHADERGTREYNLGLGERRASAAKRYLVNLGIPANRISVTSYGKERPAELGHNNAAWAKNRRAVSIVIN